MTEPAPTEPNVIGYIDLTELEDQWIQAPETADLERLARIAAGKVDAWGPALPLNDLGAAVVSEDEFARRSYAQELLIKHLWTRKAAGDGEGFGDDGYLINTFPMVREAYDAVRPRTSLLSRLI